MPVTFWLLAPLVTFVLALSTFVLFEYENSILAPCYSRPDTGEGCALGSVLIPPSSNTVRAVILHGQDGAV